MKTKIIIISLVVSALLLSSCSLLPQDAAVPVKSMSEVPQKVIDWVETYKFLHVGTHLQVDDKTYLLYAHPTLDPDANIEIVDVEPNDNDITVVVNEEIDATQGDSWSYPYALWSIANSDKEILFTSKNKEVAIPSLVDVPQGFIPFTGPEYAEIYQRYPSTKIIVGNSNLPSTIIEGVAQVFEGTVEYRLFNQKGHVIQTGFTQTTNAAPDWGYFQIDLADFPEAHKIEVFSSSAKDGSIENLVSIQINIK